MSTTRHEQLSELTSAHPGLRSAERGIVNDIDLRLRRMCHLIDDLIHQAELGRIVVDDYADATNAIETLPLATDEFQLARLRLGNSFTYCRKREFGAAVFEMRLLRNQLLRGGYHSLPLG